MPERDRSIDPDREVFEGKIKWPKPVKEPPEEPMHPDTTPLDDPEDRRWR
jgi:hypothetical protein